MKKKKFLCFLLILTLCFSPVMSFYVEASETESENTSSLADKLGNSIGQFIMKTAVAPFNFATSFSESLLTGLDTVLASNMSDWLNKGYVKPSTDGLELMPQSLQVVNDYLQGAVRKYDNYVVVYPSYSDDPVSLINNKYHPDSDTLNRIKNFFNTDLYNVSWDSDLNDFIVFKKMSYYIKNTKTAYRDIFPYFSNNQSFIFAHQLIISDTGDDFKFSDITADSPIDTILTSTTNGILNYHFDTLRKFYGSPYKLFFGKKALNTFNTRGQTFLPQLPSTFFIPKKYIDDPTLLPDITYNVDKSNKTEEVIQNEYNTIINNYITNIGGSSGDSGNTGGGSGGDSGGSGGGSGSGNITDTKLYDFLTKLWNESDKKFDKMIDLLETNNKYQKKLVDSLNDIKAILVTQTVFDAFKNRSSETANKAKEKFPTSIPWDVAMILNAMSAEPQELKFSLPIQVKSFGINESIEIDLSSEEWAKLAKTCRYLLSITFILILIQLTRKLFSSGGDD